MPYIMRSRRNPAPRYRPIRAVPTPVVEPTPEPEPVQVFDDRTKAELIAEAEALGLDTSGNKADILERLEAVDG